MTQNPAFHNDDKFVLHFSILKICVHLRPKKFGVLSSEFGVKGDKALFLILGSLGISNFRQFFICTTVLQSLQILLGILEWETRL